jgi:DNA polymerase-3 subunit epsilon
MSKDLNDIEFTIFDTETTGLDPAGGDRIVEIAAIRFRNISRISDFQVLINPARKMSEAAFLVNGISDEMLKDAPLMREVMPGFMKFIKGSCLCSYNAGFDMGFLNNELKLMGGESIRDIVVVDILKMARRMLPGQEKYSLAYVADKLGIRTRQEHRAFSDAEITLEVFLRLKEIMERKGILDFPSFSRLFGIEPYILDNLHAQRLSEIQEAIGLGVHLRIKYLSVSGAAVTEREVIPKEIKQENGRNYLVGYCCLKKEERTFRVDGILHLEVV